MTTWLPVPGWTGFYDVSDAGQVRSVARVIAHRKGVARISERILRPGINPKGYRIVARDGKRFAYPVHRLVAEAFLGPLPLGLQTCHNDGDNTNNAAANLRYDTPSANELDKVAHGHNPNAAKTHCPQGHAYTEDNTMHQSGRNGRKCRACHVARRRASRAPLPMTQDVAS